MTACSGRVCVETLLSINNLRGVMQRVTSHGEMAWIATGIHIMRLKQKTLHGFLSLYDGCVQALPTRIVVKSTCKSASTIIWPLLGSIFPYMYDLVPSDPKVTDIELSPKCQIYKPSIMTASATAFSWTKLRPPELVAGVATAIIHG